MAKRKTAGERIAVDFVGPHPTLARRIDAAIKRAVKSESHRMYELAWGVYRNAPLLTDKEAHAALSELPAPKRITKKASNP